MKLKKLKRLLENSRSLHEDSGDCIVVDVQPMYEKFIDFNISDFVKYLETRNDILFFYVGSENSGIGTDTKEDIMYWLIENGLDEDKINDIKFIDKGYAFFREYMDNSRYDDDDIIRIVKYLIEHGERDTRDIEDSDVREELGLPEDTEECIYLPGEFDIDDIKGYENAELVGGGADECLREIEIYLKAYNYSYRKNYKFIY